MKFTSKKTLPPELIDHILTFVPKRKLPVTMRVSKSWQKSATRICYRKICFTSVKQRESFFTMLENASFKSKVSANSSERSPAKQSPSRPGPPPVVIRRKSSLRNQKKESDIAKLIFSLDFGLRPRDLTVSDPHLPMTRVVLPQTQTQNPASISISPSSVMSLDSPVKSTTTMMPSLNQPSELARRTSSRLKVVESPAKTSAGKSSKTVSTSPTRQRVGAGLSVSTTASIMEDSEEAQTSYGAWAHRFVSPLVPKIGVLIPNLKELSLCGCHVNAQDFGAVLQATRLNRLDISYSTLKTDGVQLISRYCKTNLKHLNLSGIFKLGRNRSHALVGIAMHCIDLTRIVALDCPEIYPEIAAECAVVSNNRITFEMDNYAPICERFDL